MNMTQKRRGKGVPSYLGLVTGGPFDRNGETIMLDGDTLELKDSRGVWLANVTLVSSFMSGAKVRLEVRQEDPKEPQADVRRTPSVVRYDPPFKVVAAALIGFLGLLALASYGVSEFLLATFP